MRAVNMTKRNAALMSGEEERGLQGLWTLFPSADTKKVSLLDI